VAKIYDSFDDATRGKADFSEEFIKKLQAELTNIVDETVNKQMFSLT
jgi:hypothetical protein